MDPDPRETERNNMVKTQLAARGISAGNVLTAFREVPRHLFVPDEQQEYAYDDHPVPIGAGQTISQPYIVAEMVALLEVSPGDRVLEVGCGSGYQAAILAYMGAEVISVERIKDLADNSADLLSRLGYDVDVIFGDGSGGYLSKAPYNGIIAAASSPSVPGPLLDQLAEGGRLVIPVGTKFAQELKVYHKKKDSVIEYRCGGCIFVPMLGEYGWKN